MNTLAIIFAISGHAAIVSNKRDGGIALLNLAIFCAVLGTFFHI